MSIDRIYVPTYKRMNRQRTWEFLPERWKDRAFLVVTEEERPIHEAAGRQTIVSPVQGTGLAPVRKWIAEHAAEEGIRYGVLDDDFTYVVYTPYEKPESGPWNRRVTDDEWDHIMGLLDSWMDEGYVHVGMDHRWNPPNKHDYYNCFRMAGNVFYDGAKLPHAELDWLSCPHAEDYYVLLQLLTSGHPNRVSMRWRVHTHETGAVGGCSEQRNLEGHNESMRFLQEAFPRYVKDAIRKRKGYGTNEFNDGEKRKRIFVTWKKAYAESQMSTLEDFI